MLSTCFIIQTTNVPIEISYNFVIIPGVPTIPFYLFAKHLMLEYIFTQTPFQSASTSSVTFALILYCSACTTLHFCALYCTLKTFAMFK